jgi:ABC-type glycerol-3-phosphate transport system substrate-binding protein
MLCSAFRKGGAARGLGFVKTLFGTLFALLVLFSIAVYRMQPNLAANGKTPLVYVSDSNPTRDAQVGLFNRLNKDLQLSLDPANGGVEKITVQSIAGVGPDLFDAFDSNQLNAYVKSGVAWDVTEELKKRGIDVGSQTYASCAAMTTFEGRVYGVPTNAAVNCIWFHKDLFDKAGVPYPTGPWTWDKFIDTAQKLTIRDSEGHVIQYGMLMDWWYWRHVYLGFGARLFTPDGTKCVIDSPGGIASAQLMHDLIYKYRVMPSPIDETSMATSGGFGSGSITWFGAKRAAMALGGRWWLSTLRDRNNYKDLHLGVVESPYAVVRAFSGYCRGTLINKNSPRRLQALRYVLYEASEPYSDLINSQADGISAFKKYNEVPSFAFNPKHPEEDYNEVWRKAQEFAVPDENSPFVNGHVVERIIDTQLDLVKSDAKPAAAAVHDMATQINEEIQKALDQDPELRRRYDALTGRKR